MILVLVQGILHQHVDTAELVGHETGGWIATLVLDERGRDLL